MYDLSYEEPSESLLHQKDGFNYPNEQYFQREAKDSRAKWNDDCDYGRWAKAVGALNSTWQELKNAPLTKWEEYKQGRQK